MQCDSCGTTGNQCWCCPLNCPEAQSRSARLEREYARSRMEILRSKLKAELAGAI